MKDAMTITRRDLPIPTQHVDLKPENLKILLRREGSHLVAQCLQYDFAVQADKLEELPLRLAHLMSTQVIIDLSKGRIPFSSVPKAPQQYWEAWTTGNKMQALQVNSEGQVPPVFKDASGLINDASVKFAVA